MTGSEAVGDEAVERLTKQIPTGAEHPFAAKLKERSLLPINMIWRPLPSRLRRQVAPGFDAAFLPPPCVRNVHNVPRTIIPCSVSRGFNPISTGNSLPFLRSPKRSRPAPCRVAGFRYELTGAGSRNDSRESGAARAFPIGWRELFAS